jgi:hypothetical protein
MSEFIYFEDRDLHTGHGWRDLSFDELHFFFDDDDADRPLMVCHEDDAEHVESFSTPAYFSQCSYFWITRRTSYEKTKLVAADELRSNDIQLRHPRFKGCDDMEGHFEFSMAPSEVKRHLEMIGISNGETLAEALQKE